MTGGHVYALRVKVISTHTLTWSVTLWLVVYARYILYFNSHAHVERDDRRIEIETYAGISTHTLTWSVTCSFSFLCFDLYFNSHAHVERDQHGEFAEP